MNNIETVQVMNEQGDILNISLEFDGEREAATLIIEGVKYHFERIGQNKLVTEYKVDLDPDYKPQSNVEGHCYILAPFSK